MRRRPPPDSTPPVGDKNCWESFRIQKELEELPSCVYDAEMGNEVAVIWHFGNTEQQVITEIIDLNTGEIDDKFKYDDSQS